VLAALGGSSGCGSNTGTSGSATDASPRATSDGALGDATGADAVMDAGMADTPTGTDAGDVTDGAVSGSYGQPCTVGDDTTCNAGLFCLQGPSGGSVGFCTHTCPPTSSSRCMGTPPNTAAYCVVTDVDAQGDKGCAFVCRVGTRTYTCPGALQCQTTDEPPGSGQYLCLP